MKSVCAVFILVFLLFAGSARAQDDARMAFPVVCAAGTDCFILSYPDVERAPDAARDYTCGPAASDGDPFLRIGLANVGAIASNVMVVAAADGRISDAHDGVDDLVLSSRAQLKTGASLCGNGVVIDHDNGLQTAYCHLRSGSITVQKGARVVKGQVIGVVGQSGLATWPQLAFTIRKNGFYLDPITGQTPLEGCGFKPAPLIALPPAFVPYQPAAIVAMGFAKAPVQAPAIATGKAPRYAVFDVSENNITLWAMILGTRRGDTIDTWLRDPQGRSFDHRSFTLDADRERQLVNISRARGYAYWRAGLYSAEIKLTRTVNHADYSLSREITVEVK